MAYDLKITYADTKLVETVPKVENYYIDAGLLEMKLNATTMVFVPMARILKVEVEG